ncbi:hypothetical protein GCM10010531_04800 [Blastococcus jejuensis]|uniref:Uncharacterized protein n=1 Tax=Blastococcus jejuensis TaxID=351224 RepID=A0ABP6NRT9_9ACTN
MAAWERRRLARSGRVLALVYGTVLAIACSAFVVLTGWADGRSGWARLGDSIPALLLISLTGVGAVGCASMALDRRLPAGLWLIGLAPAIGTAVHLLLD